MSRKKRDRDGIFQRGSKWYISWTDASGRRRKRATEARTLTEAKIERSKKLLDAERSRRLGQAPPTDDTFEKLTERYLSHRKHVLSPAAYERVRGIIENHLRPAFRGRVAAIRRIDVEKYIANRSEDVCADTVAKEFVTLKHLLKLAVQWEIIPVNPAVGVPRPRPAPGRVRYLQPAELKTLLQAANEPLRSFIGLSVFTGMRRSEILRLRPHDIDLANSRIVLPKTKNRTVRVVHLNRTAKRILEGLEGKLFSDLDPYAVSMGFHRLCKRLKIPDFRLHDLRHTAASWMRMNGADVGTVADLLGHKDLRSAKRYQHLSPEFLGKAVQTLDAAFSTSAPLLTGAKAAAAGGD